MATTTGPNVAVVATAPLIIIYDQLRVDLLTVEESKQEGGWERTVEKVTRIKTGLERVSAQVSDFCCASKPTRLV